MPLTGLRILLIEDDTFMVALLRFWLERQGMQVSVLGDGRAAIDGLQEAPRFDAVLLDMRLPQVGGMEVLQRLRQHPDWACVPVLVLSAVDTGTEVAAALDAGANDYMTKPLDPTELLARLRRCLPAKGHAPDHAGP